MEPMLLPGRERRSHRGISGKDHARGAESAVGRFEADGDRAGGRDAFALGKRAIAGVWARSDSGERARVEGHYGKRPQERRSRRGEISAIRTCGPKNLETDSASREGGASGSAGDTRASDSGEDADAAGERSAWDGEIVRIPVAGM